MTEKEELSNFINNFKVHNRQDLFRILGKYDIVTDWEKVSKLVMNNAIDREFKSLMISVHDCSSNIKVSLNLEIKSIIKKRNQAKYEENYLEVYKYSRYLYLISNLVHYLDTNTDIYKQEAVEEETSS